MSNNIENSTSTSAIVPALPEGSMAIRSAKGRQTGTKYFVGTKSAAALKETAKSLNLKGAAMKQWVNDALREESASRAAATAAALAALTAQGFCGDTVVVRKGTASINLVKVAAEATAPSLAEQLVAKGKFATVAEAEAFLA